MLPEEGRAPSWLRDYATIEADITRMEEFARQLEHEVTANYAPHLAHVYDDILVSLPAPFADFQELVDFLTAHHTTVQNTADVVYFYRDATGGFATAARAVSERYRDVDTFAAARVADVSAALDRTAAASP